jgi:chemotaxis protein CheD
MKPEITGDVFLEPGHVCLPVRPACVWAVTGAGVVMTIFDRKLKTGGMAHYSLPGNSDKDRSPFYARPAIIGLFRLLKENGSAPDNLVASLYGAAANPDAPGYVESRGRENVEAAREILAKLRVDLAGCDIGGHWGRKVAFHSGTGECIVVKTEKIRSEDWYPETI